MSDRTRFFIGLVAAVSFAVILVGVTLADDDQAPKLFLPVAVGGQPAAVSCNIPNTHYASLSVIDPVKINVETDANFNLGYRGYVKNTSDKILRKLVVLGPVHDDDAPQFPAMFADNRVPVFTNTYQRYRWDENGLADTYSKWETTVLGMGVAPGETIYTPDSDYDIGGGYEYLVLYAGETRITLHIGREDDFPGYVIHIEDVCIDPDLLALYRQLDDAGRGELPALRGRQVFGKALGNEIKIAVRDTGHFLDPRSRNDWWQGR